MDTVTKQLDRKLRKSPDELRCILLDIRCIS